MPLGGMAAGQAMARARQQTAQYREACRARREAAQARRARLGPGEEAPAREAFQCFAVCGDCGYLVRRAPVSCPACGDTSWFDLGDHATADAIRDNEAEQRHRAPGWVKATVAGSSLAVAGGAIALAGAAPLAIGAAVLGVPFAYVLGVRPAAWLLLRWRKERPIRWHLPLGGGTPGRRLRGVVRATGAGLTTPFSRRPCLAYQVGVMFDTPGDARPPQWVLQEARGVEVRIGDEVVAGERLVPTAPFAGVSADELVAHGADVSRFLRERGLFSSDGEYEVFEAWTESDTEVEATFFTGNRVEIAPA